MPIDYSQGKIYKIVFDGSDEVYVGSTTTSLERRMYGHKASSKFSYRPSRVYQYIKQYGWDKARIELIEEYPCSCRLELEKREQIWINKIGTLNMNGYNIPAPSCSGVYQDAIDILKKAQDAGCETMEDVINMMRENNARYQRERYTKVSKSKIEEVMKRCYGKRNCLIDWSENGEPFKQVKLARKGRPRKYV